MDPNSKHIAELEHAAESLEGRFGVVIAIVTRSAMLRDLTILSIFPNISGWRVVPCVGIAWVVALPVLARVSATLPQGGNTGAEDRHRNGGPGCRAETFLKTLRRGVLRRGRA